MVAMKMIIVALVGICSLWMIGQINDQSLEPLPSPICHVTESPSRLYPSCSYFSNYHSAILSVDCFSTLGDFYVKITYPSDPDTQSEFTTLCLSNLCFRPNSLSESEIDQEKRGGEWTCEIARVYDYMDQYLYVSDVFPRDALLITRYNMRHLSFHMRIVMLNATLEHPPSVTQFPPMSTFVLIRF